MANNLYIGADVIIIAGMFRSIYYFDKIVSQDEEGRFHLEESDRKFTEEGLVYSSDRHDNSRLYLRTKANLDRYVEPIVRDRIRKRLIDMLHTFDISSGALLKAAAALRSGVKEEDLKRFDS